MIVENVLFAVSVKRKAVASRATGTGIIRQVPSLI